MSWLWIAAVSLASGLLGALGRGAGAVLLLYLRVYGGCDQLTAQGINLLFFLPIALLSILLHARNHLIDWKAAGLCVLTGLPGVLLGLFAGFRYRFSGPDLDRDNLNGVIGDLADTASDLGHKVMEELKHDWHSDQK